MIRKLLTYTLACIAFINVSSQMVLQYNTNLSSGTEVTLPLYGSVNVLVDWGDGSPIEVITTIGNANYTYANEGTYTVSISGSCEQFGSGNAYPNAGKLIQVDSFGSLGLKSLNGAFYEAKNLTQVPSSLPASVTQLKSTFYGAIKFNQDISSWDVKNVISMRNLFRYAKVFNQNIGSWNVANVIDMTGLFANTPEFDQDISTWNVSKVKTMDAMFHKASSFNRNISKWDVGNVTSMSYMFNDAGIFDQPLNSWNVAKVTTMKEMFRNCSSFNQDLSAWKVEKVLTMESMFANASSFNQDLSTWDIRGVKNMDSMFRNVELNTNFYSAMLIAWSKLPLKMDVSFHGGDSKYLVGAPETARNYLTETLNWDIKDGGKLAIPTVVTKLVKNIGLFAAESGGSIINDEGLAITEKGLVWDTLETPSLKVNSGKIEHGPGPDEFFSVMGILKPGKRYYYRAFAINDNGVGYGEIQTFRTPKRINLNGNFISENKIYDSKYDAPVKSHSITLIDIDPAYPDVSITGIEARFEDNKVGNDITVKLSKVILSGTHASMYQAEVTSIAATKADITPKKLTLGGSFNVADKPYDGTTHAEITSNKLIIVGKAGADFVRLGKVKAEFNQSEVAENIKVSIIQAEIVGRDAPNYELELPGAPTTEANISKRSSSTQYTGANGFNVYPNPFSDIIYFTQPTEIDRVSLYNTTGNVVAALYNPVNGFINVGEIPDGIYILNFQLVNGENKIYKLIRVQ